MLPVSVSKLKFKEVKHLIEDARNLENERGVGLLRETMNNESDPGCLAPRPMLLAPRSIAIST